jgi:hypothetical protein
MLLELQNDMSETAKMLDFIEKVRGQIQLVLAPSDLRASAEALDQKLMAIEGNIVDLRMTGRGQDEVRYPVMLGGQLSYLAGDVSASDFAPTQSQIEVQKILESRMKETRASLDKLVETDVIPFAKKLLERGIKPLQLPQRAE